MIRASRKVLWRNRETHAPGFVRKTYNTTPHRLVAWVDNLTAEVDALTEPEFLEKYKRG
jgi:hypothetical protein